MSVPIDRRLNAVKILVVLLCIAVSVIVALVAGILARLADAGIAAAVTQGGAAFGGALVVTLAVVAALREP